MGTNLNPEIDYIDHVCPVVADVDAAARVFERLGFLLTPLSMHQGSIIPGAPPRPLGSGNRCAMFRRSYVELLAYVRPDLPDVLRIGEFLGRFEGVHVICFGCSDVDRLAPLVTARGIVHSGVIPLQRDVETQAGVRTARFRRIVFDEGATPEGLVHVAQHLTPEFLHQARYQTHPNGARDLTNVLLCVGDDRLARVDQRYAAYLGRSSRADGPLRVFDLPRGRVSITPASALESVLPGEVPPALPSVVAYTVAVTNLAATRAVLDRNAVPVVETGGGIFVPARAALGGAVMFEQSHDRK